ncbi:hypothetical protein [Arcticibacter tournemirensis]
MKRIIFLITLFAGILLTIHSSTAQTRSDSLRVNRRMPDAKEQERHQLGFYRSSLKVDSSKAAAVIKVQNEYKAGMKALEADNSLDMETRRVRIRALMDERNRKLGTLLTAEQQGKIIPSTEREASK